MNRLTDFRLSDSGAGAIPMPAGHGVARLAQNPSDPLGADLITCRCGFSGPESKYREHGEQMAHQTRSPLVVPEPPVVVQASRPEEVLYRLLDDYYVIIGRIVNAENPANEAVLVRKADDIRTAIREVVGAIKREVRIEIAKEITESAR